MQIRFTAGKISHSYGNRKVLNDISFTLSEGEKCIITGVNGSGKSTLVKICAGLLHETSGISSLTLDGKEVIRAGSPNVAIAAPWIRWYPTLSITQNNSFFFRDSNDLIRVQKLCALFGLPADTPLAEFSTGMVQRYALAASLGSSAPLLLLDEPTEHLDQKGKDLFHEIFQERSKSRAAIIATHDGDEFQSSRRITLA
jgi:ABC-type multidrug transport system ATPase subunit